MFLESMIVSLMDKTCATAEVVRYIFNKLNEVTVKRDVGYPFITATIYMTMLMGVKLMLI